MRADLRRQPLICLQSVRAALAEAAVTGTKIQTRIRAHAGATS
jgi:hypothetical protein